MKLNELVRTIRRHVETVGIAGTSPNDLGKLTDWQPTAYDGKAFVVGFSRTPTATVWLTVASYPLNEAPAVSSAHRAHVHVTFGGTIPEANEAVILAELFREVALLALEIQLEISGKYYDRPVLQ